MIVNKQYCNLPNDFITEGGAVICNPTVCYEEYGNPEGEAVYIAHGGLSNQHAAGKYTENDLLSGWWDGVIGPHCPIDTNKYRVICSNSLGSMFGTTSPASINAETGKRMGPDFPSLTMIDMTNFIKSFLDYLGVKRLFLMAGPSMGSLQSLQMAALYPDYVERVFAVATAGRMPPSGMSMHHFMINAIEMDPEFNDGWYADEECRHSLKMIHQVAKTYFTHERGIKEVCWDTVAEGADAQAKRSKNISSYLLSSLENDIAGRDPNCYLTLTKSTNSFDLGVGASSYQEGVERIKSKVLLVNVDTDCEFAPVWGKEVADILNKANPGQARAEIITSPWGHLGCIREIKQLADLVRGFIG